MSDEHDKHRDHEGEPLGPTGPEPSPEATGGEEPTEEAATQEARSLPCGAPTGGAAQGGARRLLRSRDDRVIFGVAGGLGRYFGVDPVIVRIGFALTIFFGGLGVLAYFAAALFVPSDDGAGNPAPSQRGRGILRVAGIVVVLVIALWGFGLLIAGAAFVTAIGYGLAVVAAIALIGIVLIALSFSGRAKWLLVPALALTIGVGAAAASGLDLHGGMGDRSHRPSSAASIPADGYELGAGRIVVDLRDIDWSPTRVLDLDLRVGAGQAVVAVPSDVCVVARAHTGAGELSIAGQHSEGFDVDANAAGGARATPRLVLDADAGAGQIRVVNDDLIEVINPRGRFDGNHDVTDQELRAANTKACAA